MNETKTADRANGRVSLRARIREDIQTVFAEDPAARSVWEVALLYPGLHAVWLHRITGVEIHPGATIGRRFFIDHGMGVVIGETAEVGDDVLMYKGVVLGGTSSEPVKRHPTIDDGVVLGTDAVVLGNILIGEGAKVGSGSVIVRDVPAFATVVGVPGRIVRVNGEQCTPEGLLQHGQLPDPITQVVEELSCRIVALEKRLLEMEAQSSPLLSAESWERSER